MRVGRIQFEFTHSAVLLIAMSIGVGYLDFSATIAMRAAFVLLLSLLAHEGGHVLVAQACGVNVKSVGICWKGAFTRRSDSQDPARELAIAAAGPAVNLLIGLVLLAGGNLGSSHLVPWVGRLNLWLAIGNLIPFPGSDGRRIMSHLRSLLAPVQSPGVPHIQQ